MQIASIVLPKAGNNGENLEFAHMDLMRQLCAEFGGFTALDSVGGWIAPDGTLYQEDGKTYQVAMTDSPANRAKLQTIARHIGAIAGQLAMFITFPGGAAEIITIDEKEKIQHA